MFTKLSSSIVDRLDPGIAKRPSRFDRKYLFPQPSMEERVQYCEFWRSKLKANPEIQFPKRLCIAIAKITDDFSFAYLKEAFVAALLVLVTSRRARARESGGGDDNDDDDDLDSYPLWREIKKQIENLKSEFGAEDMGLLSL